MSNAAVHSADYFSTFLELAGLKPMSEARRDGISMLSLWRGEQAEKRTFFWHFPHRQNPSSAVIQGDRKLVHQIVENKYELFDLKIDPWEENNLIIDYAEKFEELKSLLENHLENSGAQRMRPNPDWDSTQSQGKIRNFGKYFPAEGGILQMMKEPYPGWFKEK